MPRKVRDLIKDLEKRGFECQPGKGSHRKFKHPKLAKPIIISGQLGSDAMRYQEKELKTAFDQLDKS
jgi:predicted RNA binding protein YcfA (HicA-like mRNA interferase family)